MDETTQNGTDPQGPNSEEFILLVKSPNATIIWNILSLICYKKDQIATVTLRPTGIKFTVEDAKLVQGSAFLQKELLPEYHYSKTTEEQFAINLYVLLECLNIFGPSAPQQPHPLVQMAYKGYGTPFLVMLEANDVLTDCALRTLEPEPLLSFNLRSAEIIVKLIVKSEGLKDAFSELDWSNVYCSWLVSNEQPYFRLSTDGPNGSCQVDYPRDSDVFEVFECTRLCEFKYKMKHMQPCGKALGVAQKSQIRINSEGLLSIQHRIQNEDGTASFVEFYLVPLEEDLDDNM